MREMHVEMCGECVAKNNERPPCIPTHQELDKTHRACLQVIDVKKAARLCVFRTEWEELAPLLLSGNYQPFNGLSMAKLQEMTRNLHAYLGKDRFMKYALSPEAAASCYYPKRGNQAALLEDKYLIIQALPGGGHYYAAFLKALNLNVTEAGTEPKFMLSEWRCKGSRGIGGGLGKLSVSGGIITLLDPHGIKREFKFEGGGKSVGIPKIPLGANWSDADFASRGFLIKNPVVVGFRELMPNDFVGYCVWADASIAAVGGYSITLMFVGAPLVRAVIPIAGMIAGLTAGGSGNAGTMTPYFGK